MKAYLIALLLACGIVLGFASELGTEFQAKIQATETETEALVLIGEYKNRLSELEDLRILQNYWMRLDAAACREHFAAKFAAEPQSPQYHYLWLRNQEDDLVQLDGARELIFKAPDFYWGYRLLSATISQIRLQDEPDTLLVENLEQHLDGDLALLRQGLQYFPNDDYMLLALFSHHRSKGEYAAAEQYIVRMQDPAAMEANFKYIMNFIEESKLLRPFEVLFPKMLSYAISQGKVNPADSLMTYQNYYLFLLSNTGQWAKMDAYIETFSELKERDSTLSTRIDLNLGLKRYDEALSLLESALSKEILNVNEVVDDPKYETLKTMPRWTELIAKARADWELGRQQRREKALAARKDDPAPLWELADVEGNMVKLEDFRGQIVILDFWATWCNPCGKAMPLLHQWMQRPIAKNVRVFSINTWEQDPPLATKYMRDSGFAMTLLYGNDELPKAYGFSGIPYICVIDKEGRLAFEEIGFNPNLPEMLDIWVEALSQE